MSGPPLRILVIEDEALNRALLRAVLGRAREPSIRDAEVFEAGSLAAAHVVLAAGPLDLVLLDVRLPDGSGLDLARRLAAMPIGERPKLVLMSASVLPAERAAAMAAGGDAFVGKPYHPTELLRLLSQLVEGSSGL